MIKEGKDVIAFGAGEPDFDTPDPIKNAAIAAIQSGFTKYTPTSGIPELKEAIARKLKADNGLEYNPSSVIVSCGAKHSIYNTIQVLVDEGDEVLIPIPYWVSYPEMVSLAGGKPVFIPTTLKEDFKINVNTLKKFLTKKTKILLLNSPSNPCGVVYRKDELEALAEFLKYDKHFDDDKEKRDVYKITITRGARKFIFSFGQSLAASGKYILYYDNQKYERGYRFQESELKTIRCAFIGYGRVYDKNKDYQIPDAYSVLACLTKYDPGSFENFCGDFGYDTDSRRAEKTYKAVQDEYKNVKMLWSDAEIEKLREIQ